MYICKDEGKKELFYGTHPAEVAALFPFFAGNKSAARQSLLQGKLQLGLVAHDIFHTARYHSLRTSMLMSSETWVRPTYPNIVLSVSYHFRQPSAKAKEGALSKEAEFVEKDF